MSFNASHFQNVSWAVESPSNSHQQTNTPPSPILKQVNISLPSEYHNEQVREKKKKNHANRDKKQESKRRGSSVSTGRKTAATSAPSTAAQRFYRKPKQQRAEQQKRNRDTTIQSPTRRKKSKKPVLSRKRKSPEGTEPGKSSGEGKPTSSGTRTQETLSKRTTETVTRKRNMRRRPSSGANTTTKLHRRRPSATRIEFSPMSQYSSNNNASATTTNDAFNSTDTASPHKLANKRNSPSHHSKLSPSYQYRKIMEKYQLDETYWNLDERMTDLMEMARWRNHSVYPEDMEIREQELRHGLKTSTNPLQKYRDLLVLYHTKTNERYIYWWNHRNRRDIATKIYDYGERYPTEPSATSKVRKSKSRRPMSASSQRTSKAKNTIKKHARPSSAVPKGATADLSFTIHPASSPQSKSHAEAAQGTFITQSTESSKDEKPSPAQTDSPQPILHCATEESSDNFLSPEKLRERELELQLELQKLQIQIPTQSVASKSILQLGPPVSTQSDTLAPLNTADYSFSELSEENIEAKLNRVQELRMKQQQLLRDLEGRFMPPQKALYEKIETIQVEELPSSDTTRDTSSPKQKSSGNGDTLPSPHEKGTTNDRSPLYQRPSSPPPYTKYDLQNIEITIENDFHDKETHEKLVDDIWKDAEKEMG